MSNFEQLPRTVQRITKLHFEGNVTPNSWFKHIRLKSGKVDTNAIILLSEIVFFYRAIEERGQTPGESVFRKKFAADKWQASYQELADKFGLTKRQTIDALKRLRDAGFITIEQRVIRTKTGLVCLNATYIEPIPEAIEAITFSKHDVTYPTLERNPSYVKTEVGLRSSDMSSYVKTEDNTYISTEIPTETTTENNNTLYSSSFDERETENHLPSKSKENNTGIYKDTKASRDKEPKEQYKKLLEKYFERYWSAEPRKVDKDRARRAWMAKFGKFKEFPVANFDAYMNARIAEAEMKKAEHGNLRFLKHPATWINATDFTSPPSIEELEALGLVEETIRWERADDDEQS